MDISNEKAQLTLIIMEPHLNQICLYADLFYNEKTMTLSDLIEAFTGIVTSFLNENSETITEVVSEKYKKRYSNYEQIIIEHLVLEMLCTFHESVINAHASKE